MKTIAVLSAKDSQTTLSAADLYRWAVDTMPDVQRCVVGSPVEDQYSVMPERLIVGVCTVWTGDRTHRVPQPVWPDVSVQALYCDERTAWNRHTSPTSSWGKAMHFWTKRPDLNEDEIRSRYIFHEKVGFESVGDAWGYEQNLIVDAAPMTRFHGISELSWESVDEMLTRTPKGGDIAARVKADAARFMNTDSLTALRLQEWLCVEGGRVYPAASWE